MNFKFFVAFILNRYIYFSHARLLCVCIKILSVWKRESILSCFFFSSTPNTNSIFTFKKVFKVNNYKFYALDLISKLWVLIQFHYFTKDIDIFDTQYLRFLFSISSHTVLFSPLRLISLYCCPGPFSQSVPFFLSLLFLFSTSFFSPCSTLN